MQNVCAGNPTWGFWAHQRINRLAVFTLPIEMQPFFKKHIEYLTENAVNPDKRRYAVVGEAPRHYIDAEAYGDSALYRLPLFWNDAVAQYTEDTLALNGIVPWAIQQYKYQLTEAFRERNTRRILRVAADLGHYIADANVPLHTTRNYNGQLTGQEGIHAFWESRLPELFAEEYDMFTGAATYEEKTARRAWQAVRGANAALDSVLRFERELTARFKPEQKYALEDRNGTLLKTYSREFSQRYHQMLAAQVERQMRASVKMVGDFWMTCWIDAGQPDLTTTTDLTEIQKKEDESEKQNWLKRLLKVRTENEN
ncbi:MAG: zinc dependent phospholipase C family protein [Spirosomaceae bacterium]|nr:zinc dependent phospholipase C family protein [Spirosomataceae bacterium]